MPAIRTKASAAIVALVFLFAAFGQGLAESSASGPLDGMVFAGKFGPEGNPDLDDELRFQDGKFWSSICVKCGFLPGDYWVRTVGDSILFRGELAGERGTFTYAGRIVDGEIDVAINWTNDRWYWSINRNLAFKGSLKETGIAISAQQAIQIAAEATPELNPECRL